MPDPIIYESEFITVRQGNHHPYVDVNCPCVSFQELYNELQDAKAAVKLAETNKVEKSIRNAICMMANFDNGLQLVNAFTDELSKIFNLSLMRHELAEMSDSTLAEVESTVSNWTLANWTPAENEGCFYRYDYYSKSLLGMPMSKNEYNVNFVEQYLVSKQAFDTEHEMENFIERVSKHLGIQITQSMIGS